MRRTSITDLAAAFALLGVGAFVALRVGYGDIPPLQYPIVIPVAALAIAELVAARRVRAAVRHEPGARPMAALVIARCVALGKASALVGAGMAGAAVALLVRVLPDAGSVRAAANDVRVGLALLAGAVLLLVAGLLLERAGVDPGNPIDHPRIADE